MSPKKTLLLFRHAKSSWADAGIADQDRPLNERGRKAAARMGRLMRDERITPDLVLSSTSRRTRETAELAFAELGPSPFPVHYLDDLYHADPTQIAHILSQISEPDACVMLLGHNPGLEEFLALHTGQKQSFPTAGLAVIDFKLKSWNQFSESLHGNLRHLWKPKQLNDDT